MALALPECSSGVLTLPVMVMKLSKRDRVHGTDPLPFIVGAIIADGGPMFKMGWMRAHILRLAMGFVAVPRISFGVALLGP